MRPWSALTAHSVISTIRSNLVFILFFSTLRSTVGLNIARLSVPRVVEANTTAVVLDCEYVVEEWEREGLVVKWNMDSVSLVYQWIPPLKPQALGALSGRVDTSYQASIHPWAKHRAIYIPKPDPTLTGRYSCTVSTFEDEDTREADMLVWTQAKRLDLRYWRPSFYEVQITCLAEGIFPRPVFYLYTKHANWSRQEVHVIGRSTERHEGLLLSTASGLISWSDTARDTIIGCTMTLPGTPHARTLTKVYTPDIPVITTTTTTTTTTQPYPADYGSHKAKGWSNSTHNFFASSDGVRISSVVSLQPLLYKCFQLLTVLWSTYLSTPILL